MWIEASRCLTDVLRYIDWIRDNVNFNHQGRVPAKFPSNNNMPIRNPTPQISNFYQQGAVPNASPNNIPNRSPAPQNHFNQQGRAPVSNTPGNNVPIRNPAPQPQIYYNQQGAVPNYNAPIRKPSPQQSNYQVQQQISTQQQFKTANHRVQYSPQQQFFSNLKPRNNPSAPQINQINLAIPQNTVRSLFSQGSNYQVQPQFSSHQNYHAPTHYSSQQQQYDNPSSQVDYPMQQFEQDTDDYMNTYEDTDTSYDDTDTSYDGDSYDDGE